MPGRRFRCTCGQRWAAHSSGQAGRVLRIPQPRVVDLAAQLGVGVKVGRTLHFTAADLELVRQAARARQERLEQITRLRIVRARAHRERRRRGE